MDVAPTDDPGLDVSPAKAMTLVAVGIVAALIGISILSTGASPEAKKRRADADRSFECIVASAVFVGASGAEPAPH